MRKALNRGRVNIAVYIDALRLFCEYYRTAEILGGNTGDTDTRRLNGEYLVDCFIGKQSAEFFSYLVVQRNIHLMIEKAVYLKNISLFDNAVFSDTLF